ncbi:MAG: Ig-like domain-containing protein [Proteobacteria bacterium]|nr:Ig-like domain-containing protein [Pseudomonadota bacterium]
MNRTESTHTPLLWLIAFLMSALVAGCGGGQDSIPAADGAAGLAPTVTAVFPTPNATGVPVNTKIITAAFTKAMDPATLTTASFTLTCPAGTPQTGTVGYVTTGDVATLTLVVASSLPASSVCTATISTAAKDTSGIPLGSNFIWSFTTGSTSVTTSPTVTGTIHTNGQTNVAINTKVGATFSDAMDPLTINVNTFTLMQGTTAVAGTVTYAGVNAVFTPASNLAPNTTYTATVTTGAKDVRGNPLASNFVISWTTGAVPDTTPPTVTGTINANGATNVAINSAAGATFSEGMDPLSITNVNFTLTTDAGAVIPGVVSYSGVSAVFRPLGNLANSTHYNVTIKGGATGVKDLAGNPMAADFKTGWTTAAVPDTTAPTVTGTVNANGATNVAINSAAGATFSEAMDPLTITNVNYTLTTDAGTVVPGVVSYSGVTVVFRPLANLGNGTHYNVTIKGGLTGVKDLAGNPLATDFKIGWTTAAAADTTAPTVTGTSNDNGAINVAINTPVGAAFSEAMDPLTITNVNFTLKATTSGTAVPGTTSYSGVSAVFTPSSNLVSSTNYTATIKGGIGGAKDLAGNPLASDYVWSWTTGAAPDTTAPTVTRTIHANGATNVAINTTIGATFSEGMNPLTITNLNMTLKTTATGAVVPGTLSYTGVSATILPLNALAPGTNYTVTVKGGVNGVKDLAGNPMANDFVISWTTAATADTTAPTVISTINANGATNVPVNTKVGANFSEGMDPLTINTVTFTMKAATTGIGVAGTISYSGTSALFVPWNNLAGSTRYTATIKGGINGAKDLAGNPLASDYVWSFTTEVGLDTTPPTLMSTDPAMNAIDVPTNALISAIFSEPMNPLTMTTASFKLACPVGTDILGVVRKGTTDGTVATFRSIVSLPINTRCTATIAGMADLAGNPLEANSVPNPWSFTTGAVVIAVPPPTPDPVPGPGPGSSTGVCVGAACVDIGTAANYAILAKAGVDTVPSSAVTGNIGVSPIARVGLTGWSQVLEPTDTFWTSAQVTGKLYASDMVGGTTTSDLSTAIGNMGTAYTTAGGMAKSGGALPAGGPRECPGVGAMSDTTNALPGGGGFPVTGLPAGVYTCAVNVTIPDTLTLNGSATDVWVFRITGKLTQANGKSVLLTGGALAENVFWRVSDTVTIGTTAHIEGVILAQTNIALQTGASIKGRLLAQTAVTLDKATVTKP